jgi:hypothetical protein
MKRKSKSNSEIILYQTEDGRTQLEVRLENETVWLTQGQMAELFQTTQQNISLHLQNIYAESELERGATHKESLLVRQEGPRSVQRRVDFYNLDAIISVGYRVKSHIATRFRIWATQRLREYIVKGFTLDDERLKNPGPDRPDCTHKHTRAPDGFRLALRNKDCELPGRQRNARAFGPARKRHPDFCLTGGKA